MNTPVNVVILEDNESDVKLVLHELRRAGFEPAWTCADTADSFLMELNRRPDVILCDYRMPQFDAPAALRLLQERGLDIPFIIISGTVGEEAAVAAMKQGATDYLLKDRLGRLGQAVSGALEQKRLRDRHHQALESLQESEERTRRILNTAYDPFVAMDAEGWIIDWNARAEEVFGWTRDEAIGRRVSETIVPERDRDAHENGRNRFLTSGAGRIINRNTEFTAVHRDGHEIPVELIVWPVVVRGTVTFGAFLHDITARRSLEEQLRQAQKMEAIGRLAGGVAHDFNNILTAILGFTNLVLKNETDPMKRQDLSEVVQAAERAASLTRQLLAFSRKQALQPTVVNFNALVADLTKMLQRVIGEHINLELKLDPRLENTSADPAQVEQILMNLAVNAHDAMPNGGKLTIETRNTKLNKEYANAHPDVEPGDYAMLCVSDNGCGMDDATKQRVFEPFFTTKGPGRGTGLGLSTVYGIVKQHGGHVAVYSELNNGTTFKVYMRKIMDDVADRESSETPDATGSETILLVEDEESVRAVAKRYLQNAGYRVLEAESAEAAELVFSAHRSEISLLLTDVVMPGASGKALYDELSRAEPTLKVLYMSGYTENAIVHQGMLDPKTPYLEKPFDTTQLTHKIREVLDAASS